MENKVNDLQKNMSRLTLMVEKLMNKRDEEKTKPSE